MLTNCECYESLLNAIFELLVYTFRRNDLLILVKDVRLFCVYFDGPINLGLCCSTSVKKSNAPWEPCVAGMIGFEVPNVAELVVISRVDANVQQLTNAARTQ